MQLTAKILYILSTKTIEIGGRIIDLQPIKTYGQFKGGSFLRHSVGYNIVHIQESFEH